MGFVLVALFADVLAPHAPTDVSLVNRLRPPAWVETGSTEYILGTDQLGRDVLSRVIHGARISLLTAFLALTLGAGVGAIVGLVAGYTSGVVGAILMRLADLAMSIPLVLFALLFVVASRPSVQNVVIAIGLVLWAQFARVIRGEVLSVREREFVSLARVAGASDFWIISRHVFPNVLNTLIVLATLQVGFIIVIEGGLSFLGAGVPPPAPAWGSMIAEGRDLMTSAWWITLFPGLTMMVIVLGFNLMGDWLRDVLDPRVI